MKLFPMDYRLFVNNFSEVLASKTFGQCIHTNILSEVTIDILVLFYSTSYFPDVTRRANLREPATLHRSPILTKLVCWLTTIGSKPIEKKVDKVTTVQQLS